MDLSFNSKMEAYYQTFFELQERLRKSEEERLKLEMKFNELLQISREEEQAHYKKLRSQYKKFLEEDRKRQERNEKIIRTLERIESRVNTLTSKTERVKTLRRQYQSYMQRISQRPVAKHEYVPPKVTVEIPSNERKFNFDYDKKSSDIAMLKRAYGKTNDEKIEILDKYLQNLKSQKDQTTTDSKPSEDKTEFNEMKYFDEVSKKLNEGFDSNKANSIAEDIMNSIYARHYKTDLYQDEAKNVSKFTSPRYESSYSGKEKRSGFGDSLNNYQPASIRNNPSFDLHGNRSKIIGAMLKTHDSNAFDEENNAAKYLRPFEEELGKVHKNYEETLHNNVDLSPQLNLKENMKTPEEIHKNDKRLRENNVFGLSKTETDLNENEKQNSGIEANLGNVLEEEFEANHVKNDVDTKDSRNIPEFTKEDKTNLTANVEQQQQSESYDTRPERQTEDAEDASNDIYESEDMRPTADSENLMNTIDFINKQGNEVDEFNQQYETRFDDQCNKQTYDESNQQLQAQYENRDETFDEHAQQYDQLDQYDSSEQPIEQLYGENGKALLQYGENGQAVYDQEYDEDVQSNQLIFQENGKDIPRYDSNVHEIHNQSGQPSQEHDVEEQPIQMYQESTEPVQQNDDNNEYTQQLNEHGQSGEEISPSVQQYEGNEQPFQQCDENGQLVQQSDENGQFIQQYNENEQVIEKPEDTKQSVEPSDGNTQPIQQYDENNQPIQQYDDNGQTIQQYDENGQPIQPYGDNGQLIQQYDENGQPIQPYDENGQPIQQYDENGQPIQQYDENGQPVHQYDENGQPILQYDENGQPIQQYDENGQPIYYNPGDEIVQYDENGQIIQQYDENGQPIAPVMYDESYQHYDPNGQPTVDYDGQLPNEFENGQSLQQYEANHSAGQEEQNVQNDVKENIVAQDTKPENENIEQRPQKKNVLDLLDTDSESVKQNTSKISNGSDFDFSNG